MVFSEWFAKRLHGLRQLEGMTQREFAETSGIGIATIERIECGKTSPNVETCLLIARVLGISLSELFEGYE